MSKVLFIKANDREQAVSLQLYDMFLEVYRDSNPSDEITELDLFRAELPYFDNKMFSGLYKLAQGLDTSSEEQQAADTANYYLEQFMAADKVVFAFPLWNFTIPAQLLTYLSYLYQVGKVVKYTEHGAVGLLSDKKAVLLNARGGVYSEGPALNSEMAVAYMAKVLNAFGITSLEKVIVEGHNQFPERAEHIITAGVSKAAELAMRF